MELSNIFFCVKNNPQIDPVLQIWFKQKLRRSPHDIGVCAYWHYPEFSPGKCTSESIEPGYQCISPSDVAVVDSEDFNKGKPAPKAKEGLFNSTYFDKVIDGKLKPLNGASLKRSIGSFGF